MIDANSIAEFNHIISELKKRLPYCFQADDGSIFWYEGVRTVDLLLKLVGYLAHGTALMAREGTATNVTEYIDKETAIKRIISNYDSVLSVGEAIEELDSIPAADVVPVVRCKDCKFGEIDDMDFPNQYYCQSTGDTWNNGDFFCADGEKRVNGEA